MYELWMRWVPEDEENVESQEERIFHPAGHYDPLNPYQSISSAPKTSFNVTGLRVRFFSKLFTCLLSFISFLTIQNDFGCYSAALLYEYDSTKKILYFIYQIVSLCLYYRHSAPMNSKQLLRTKLEEQSAPGLQHVLMKHVSVISFILKIEGLEGPTN